MWLELYFCCTVYADLDFPYGHFFPTLLCHTDIGKILAFYQLHKLFSGMGVSGVGGSAQTLFSGTCTSILICFLLLNFPFFSQLDHI